MNQTVGIVAAINMVDASTSASSTRQLLSRRTVYTFIIERDSRYQLPASARYVCIHSVRRAFGLTSSALFCPSGRKDIDYRWETKYTALVDTLATAKGWVFARFNVVTRKFDEPEVTRETRSFRTSRKFEKRKERNDPQAEYQVTTMSK